MPHETNGAKIMLNTFDRIYVTIQYIDRVVGQPRFPMEDANDADNDERRPLRPGGRLSNTYQSRFLLLVYRFAGTPDRAESGLSFTFPVHHG